MAYDRTAWSQHYEDGNDFRALSDAERDLLAQHAPATDNAHALDIGCGTGELATHLASHGYDVDAVDYADGALIRAPSTGTWKASGGYAWTSSTTIRPSCGTRATT